LRRIGGWDAWNVTEDADIGFRLARFGYESETLTSTTYEEAPISLGAFFRQRRRWCKGWYRLVKKMLKFCDTNNLPPAMRGYTICLATRSQQTVLFS
jgi:cellulose synthase/poly-beta-1,6-N-acetylglucosamine synthase-like glycosyltransferase